MRSIIFSLLLIVVFSSCFLFYKFRDLSISSDIKTFYIEDFLNNTTNAPPTLNIDFHEELRKRIINETSLTWESGEPNIIFSGTVQSFEVSSHAPTQGGSAINRLNIKILVNFQNTLNKEEDWETVFGYDVDFPAEQSLTDVQDDLISEIFEHILDDVINKAFNNW